MKIYLSITLSMLVLISAGFTVVEAEELSGAQKEVWEIVEAAFNARARLDIETYLKYCHKDGVFWPSTAGWPLNKEELDKAIKGRPIKEGELTPYAIKIFGDVAIAQYKWSGFEVMDAYLSGRITTVLMKQDDKWQVIGYIATSR